MKIAPEQASRVLDEAGPLAKGVERDEMLRILIRLTDIVRGLILSIPLVERTDKSALAIRKTLETLNAQLAGHPSQFGQSPPAIPDEWRAKMQEWIQQSIYSPGLGNPGGAQRNALLLLCSLYRLAFRPDAVKPDKHTYDFVRAWFTAFGPAIEAATERVKPGNPGKLRTKEWDPSPEALRKALQKYFADKSADQVIDSCRLQNAEPF